MENNSDMIKEKNTSGTEQTENTNAEKNKSTEVQTDEKKKPIVVEPKVEYDRVSNPRYDEEPAVVFENVSKRYFLYASDKARFKAMFTSNRGVKEHPALENVSFKIYPGESVGFVGRNGAGKSTILKMITGVSYPSSGDVTVRGKVAALLELTAGFYPDMTGRENIGMKGLILGLTEGEIEDIEDDIVEFADLGEYIDQPVRTYSSGMKTRLGFAININIRPDILVVDEALSVGDARFRKKCNRAIKELIKTGVTVLFVSHSIESLRETCDRGIYLKDGSVALDGEINQVLATYSADIEKIRQIRREKRETRKKKLERRRKRRAEKAAREAKQALALQNSDEAQT